MRTYQALAEFIKANAITRGKTKGNAPVGRIANSSREFIRYESGEGSCIVGYQGGYDARHKVFTVTPEGVLTIHGKHYYAPSTNEFMARVLGLEYCMKPYKSVNHEVVRAKRGSPFYLVSSDMVFDPDGTCRNPQEFVGKRVNREQTAINKAKLKEFTDLFCLWFTPRDVSEPMPKYLFPHVSIPHAMQNEERWGDLFVWLSYVGFDKWNVRRWDRLYNKITTSPLPEFTQPLAYIKHILVPALTSYERFATGTYHLPG